LPDVAFGHTTLGFSELLPAGNECRCLHVIHRHAAEGLTDIKCRSEWIWPCLGPFRIHVNQPHLNGAERIVPLTRFLIAAVGQPGVLRPPIGLVFLPDVLAPATETEGLEAHRIQSDVPGQNHEVAPGQFPPILLLYRPEQSACLIEACVVRPAPGGRKTRVAMACPAAAVTDAVR